MIFWLKLLIKFVLAWGWFQQVPLNFTASVDTAPSGTVEYPADATVSASSFAAFTYTTFNSPRLDEHLGRYLQQVAVNGPPDILIVGSSRALQGVDPVALQQALIEQGYGRLTVYNFGINGATAQVVDFLLRQVLTPQQLPRLIVWADGARALNSGRSDRTMQAILDSEGYALLSAGIRPTLPELVIQESANCENSQLVGVAQVSAPHPQLQCFLPPTKRWEELSPFLQSLMAIAPNLTLNELTETGFFSDSTRFNPQTYYQTQPRIAGQYDGDYHRFTLQGEQAIATQNLLKFTQSQNIPLVFVNLPLTQDYLDATRRSYENQLYQQLQNWAKQGLIVANLNLNTPELQPLKQPDFFTDPSHINRYGAEAVARQLAQTQTIPWPNLSYRSDYRLKT